MSPIISYVATAAYLADDRLDEALIEGQRTLQLDPHYFYLDSVLAAAYREKGNFAEAIALYTKAQEATHFPSSGLAITYARMGHQAEARNILDQLLQERQTRYVSAQMIAAVYVAFGEKDEAFRWLDLAYRTLGNTAMDRVPSRVWCAPWRRAFPSTFTTNRRFARLSSDDYGSNAGRD